jgi:hypothetical protein
MIRLTRLASSFTPITVEEGAVVQAGNVAVVPFGAIQGTVTDEMGEPVAGAEVTVLRYGYLNGLKTLLAPAQAAPGTTDARGRGRYRISAVLPGRYYVRVSVASFRRPGATPASMVFAPVYYPNAEAASRAVRIEVYPGAGTPPVNFRLRPTGAFHLRGSVVGISDKIRPRVIEIASCTPGVREDPALVTAAALQADGSFDAEGVTRGTYCLTFQGLSANEFTSFAREVVTVINRDIENIRLAASPPLDISGVVTLEEGASLKMPASVKMPTAVQLRPATQMTVPSSTGSVDGTNGVFRLVGVRREDYKLAVSPVPTGGYIKSMKFGGVDVTDGNINPSGGGTLVIQIGAARCSLTGRVDFGSGKPVNGMRRVTLAPDGALRDRIDLIRTVFANDKGEFNLTDLAPGSYRIFPWEKFEFDLAQSPEFLSLFSASSVRVAEGEQPNVEVKMISSSEIEAAKARF